MPTFVVGSDPEFGFVDRETGKQVYAHSLPFRESGKFGFGTWGMDGHQDVGEFRAKQSQYVPVHVDNICKLLAELATRMDEFPSLGIHGGSYIFVNKADPGTGGDAIGGHVHVSCLDMDIFQHSKEIQDVFDYWVAPVVRLIEEPMTATLRRKTSYGKLGDIRQQKWGWEYRPMSSWLVSPGVASAVLSLVQASLHAWAVGAIQPHPVSARITEAYVTGNEKVLLPHFFKVKESWPLPLAMENRAIAGSLGYLNHLISRGMFWREKVDMRAAWGVEPYVPDHELGSVLDSCRSDEDISPARSFPSFNPVRWPGPGRLGHTIFKAIFANTPTPGGGFRLKKMIRQGMYPIILGCVESLPNLWDVAFLSPRISDISNYGYIWDTCKPRAYSLGSPQPEAVRQFYGFDFPQHGALGIVFRLEWLERWTRALSQFYRDAWPGEALRILSEVCRVAFDSQMTIHERMTPEDLSERTSRNPVPRRNNLIRAVRSSSRCILDEYIWYETQL